MKAIAIEPGASNLQMIEVAEPRLESPTQVLIRTIRVGVCGTDRIIARGEEGVPPPGSPYLILGHEMLGRVEQVGERVRSFFPGFFVVPTVRRGCGQCSSCLEGMPDMCYTGLTTERGIVGAHGFMSEFVVEEAANLVTVPDQLEDVAVLIEPLSTDIKAIERARQALTGVPPRCGHSEHAWEQHDWGRCKRALVAGVGPMGVLAALVLRSQAVDTYVTATQPTESFKAQLVEKIGAHYLNALEVDWSKLQETIGLFDLVFEATGAASVPFQIAKALGPNGIMVAVGVPVGKTEVSFDGASWTRELVLGNRHILGSVNSNISHFRTAVRYLGGFKRLLGQATQDVITHRYALNDYRVPFASPSPATIKAVIEF